MPGTASHYRDFANPTYNWKYRACITVDVGSATGSRDAQITIPPAWDHFWSTVRSAGEDIRVTAADGTTLVTFDLAGGFSTTTRTGVIEIDNYTVPGTGSRVYTLWLYWGQADCTTGISGFVPASPDTGYIELSRPGGRTLVAAPERPGDTIARQRVSKGQGETVHVWINLSPLLGTRREPYGGNQTTKVGSTIDYEAVSTVTYDVQTGGASQAAMISVPATRVVEYEGELWARIQVAAGSDDVDYTLLVTVGTTLSQVLVPRALVLVRTVAET